MLVFLRRAHKDEGWIWRDWELSGIELHDVKFPKDPFKNYVSEKIQKRKKKHKKLPCLLTTSFSTFRDKSVASITGLILYIFKACRPGKQVS